MSKDHRDAAWRVSLPTVSAKLVLLCLAEHSNSKGVCWPSVDRMMTLTGLSRSSVTRAISSLKKAGLITVTSKKMRNSYTLNMKAMSHCDPLNESSCAMECVTMTHSMSHHDPLIEPSVEPSEEPEVNQGSPKPGKPKLTLVGGKEKTNVATLSDIVGNKEWKKLPKSKKQTMIGALEQEWREAILSFDPDSFVAALTAAQRGQLGHMVNRVGFEPAKTLLAAAVGDWGDFAYYVQGLGIKAPEEPQIGFLLWRIEDAISWHKEQAKKPVTLTSNGTGKPKAHIPEF